MKIFTPKVSPNSKKFTHPAIQMGNMHFFIYDSSASVAVDGSVTLPYAQYYRSRGKWIEDRCRFKPDSEYDCKVLVAIYEFAVKKGYITKMPAFLDAFKMVGAV